MRPKLVKVGWVRLCEKDLRLSFCPGVGWGLQLLDRLAPSTFQKVATFSLLIVDLTQLRNLSCYWAAAQRCSNSLHLTNRPTSSLPAQEESQPSFNYLPTIVSFCWCFNAQHVVRHRYTQIVALAGEHPPAPKSLCARSSYQRHTLNFRSEIPTSLGILAHLLMALACPNLLINVIVNEAWRMLGACRLSWLVCHRPRTTCRRPACSLRLTDRKSGFRKPVG